MTDELQREYDLWCENHPELVRKPKAEQKPEPRPAPKPEPADGQWLDNKIGNFILQVVGPAVDAIAERINKLLDQEQADREKLAERLSAVEDRERENMVAIAKLEAANAKLELELVRATTNNQRGTVIDYPSLKTVN